MQSSKECADSASSRELTKLAESCIVHGIDNQPSSQHAKTKVDVNFALSSPAFKKVAYDVIGKKLLFVRFTFALVANDRRQIRMRIKDTLEHFFDHTELLRSLYDESNPIQPGSYPLTMMHVKVSDDISFGQAEEYSIVFLAGQQTLQLMFACILRLRKRMNRIDIHATTATDGGRALIEQALLQTASHVGGIDKLSLSLDGFPDVKTLEMRNQLRTSCETRLASIDDHLSLLRQNLLTFLDLISDGVPLHTLLPSLTMLCRTLLLEPGQTDKSQHTRSSHANSVIVSCFILIFASMSEHMLRRPNTAEAQGHCYKQPGGLTSERLGGLLYHVARSWQYIRVSASLNEEPEPWCALLQARAQLYLAFARSAHLHSINGNVSCDYLTEDNDAFDPSHSARRWLKLANADIRFIEIFFTRSRNLTDPAKVKEWVRVCTNLRDTISNCLIEGDLFDPIDTEPLSSLIQFEHHTARYNIWEGTGYQSWRDTLMSNR